MYKYSAEAVPLKVGSLYDVKIMIVGYNLYEITIYHLYNVKCESLSTAQLILLQAISEKGHKTLQRYFKSNIRDLLMDYMDFSFRGISYLSVK